MQLSVTTFAAFVFVDAVEIVAAAEIVVAAVAVAVVVAAVAVAVAAVAVVAAAVVVAAAAEIAAEIAVVDDARVDVPLLSLTESEYMMLQYLNASHLFLL